jgi:hypothetical protein
MPIASSDIKYDAFGNWLAGLIDGEGHFMITLNQARVDEHGERRWASYWCGLKIEMRADDKPALEYVQTMTGLGRISDAKWAGPNNGARWLVTTKSDCLALIELLERCPLRTKKARDFELWANAVRLWHSRERGDSWEPFAVLKAELQEGRAYANR